MQHPSYLTADHDGVDHLNLAENGRPIVDTRNACTRAGLNSIAKLEHSAMFAIVPPVVDAMQSCNNPVWLALIHRVVCVPSLILGPHFAPRESKNVEAECLARQGPETR
jgi:hypothetical protein